MHPAWVITILCLTMASFIWGKIRYELTALLALAACALIGVVPLSSLYNGMSNAAVITVACVMVISQTIIKSGVLYPITHRLSQLEHRPTLQAIALCSTTMACSAFMNNIGALALMMPIAIESAHRANRSPALILMPLAFSSALGGLITQIGTPPNLIISNYRASYLGTGYHLFDYSSVGLVIAISGVILLATALWRLIPKDRAADKAIHEALQTQSYMTELYVPENSPLANDSVRSLETQLQSDITVLGIIHQGNKLMPVHADHIILPDDILIIRAPTQELESLIQQHKLLLVAEQHNNAQRLHADNAVTLEAIITPGSKLSGQNSKSIQLRSHFRINLLAIARNGQALNDRLSDAVFQTGDVVLIQASTQDLHEHINDLGLLPLIEREVTLTRSKRLLPLVLFVIAIIMILLNMLPVDAAFSLVVLTYAVFNLVSIKQIYQSIDWSTVILLAAMIPVGQGLESSGASTLLAQYILSISDTLSPTLICGVLMLVTMTLSDFINNAATAVIMAPIAVTLAQHLGLNIDPFLMTVAIGASCSFLTPVGHQNNLLVMGAGGYRFSDFIRLGLPLECMVIGISLLLIPVFWPFQ